MHSLQGSEESQMLGMGTGGFPKNSMTIDLNRTSGQGHQDSLINGSYSPSKAGASFLDIETPPVNKTMDRLTQQRIDKKAADLARKKRLEAQMEESRLKVLDKYNIKSRVWQKWNLKMHVILLDTMLL